MKKRCEICGKIYESPFGSSGYLNMSYPVTSDDRVEHTEHFTYQTCTDCAKNVSIFIDNMIDGYEEEAKETKEKETDVPNKTGYWSFLYSPITHTTVIKCSECGFTIEADGRLNGEYINECPACNANMGARSND